MMSKPAFALKSTLLIALLATVIALPLAPTAAVPKDPVGAGICAASLNYTLADPWPLSSTTHGFLYVSQSEQIELQIGFERWEEVENQHNAQVVEANDTSSSTVINVYWYDLPTGTWGQASCNNRRIRVDPHEFDSTTTFSTPTSTDLAEYGFVGRHEMGHIWGLEHAGNEDNLASGTAPTMTTCSAADPASTRGFTSEDRAALYLHRGPHIGGDNVLVSNHGFEDGTLHHHTSSNTTWSIQTSGSHTGSQHARFTQTNPSSSTSAYVGQKQNYSTPYQGVLFAHPVRARAYARVESSTSSKIRLKLAYRGVDYNNGGSCSFPYGDRSEGRSDVRVWVTVKNNPETPSTSWKKIATGLFYVRNDASGVAAYHGMDSHDLRARLVSEVNGAWVRVDTMSIREDP